MAKHQCAICGAEVGLISEQKLADGNYICRKVCAKKCLKNFNKVEATLDSVNAHIEQVQYGTRVWDQIFVPLTKGKTKEKQMQIKDILGHTGGVVFADRFVDEVGNKLCEIYGEIDLIMMIDVAKKKVSYRTAKDDVNVAEFANRLASGGGHVKAAGSQIPQEYINSFLDLSFANIFSHSLD